MIAPPLLPVMLQLADRLCVVVGGGSVALRKTQVLLAAGARVRVVAPQLLSAFAALPGLDCRQQPFAPEVLRGAVLVCAATDDPAANAAVVATAQAQGLLVNCADGTTAGDVHFPAVLRRGPLTVTVASHGTSPALAVGLRNQLDHQIGPEWAVVAEIMAALRQKRLTGTPMTTYNSNVVSRLLDAGLPTLIARGDCATIDRLLAQVAGTGVSLATLGVQIEKGTT